MNEEREEIIKRAIAAYGERTQKVVAIEELPELQKEICKDLRGDANLFHIAEEIADVEIMLMQLIFIYKNEDVQLEERVNDWMSVKFGRLESRLNQK